ncbi:aminoglycoside phosphotransferase family protein [Actinomarinicola tropica]|uniref:Phosphotransferase n=1 Tax=Actinomarinicola tropica TaxID=2789776 RepID=A0A5Q2RHT0_9ACTN|nr:aminoglycoside phosphotransferase family protein [Actinomarinicola tropica]QGG96418.1 phosphotransferase [Actinomarinicola tropica]
MDDLPPAVRNKALSLDAQRWLDELPDVVASLVADWGLTLGPSFVDGTESYVVAVDLVDGTPAVLKVLLPRDDAVRHETTALRLADGDGSARLLRHDLDRSALLIERLGPSLHDLGVPFARRREILCDLASRMWRPAAGHELPTGAEKGRWLAGFVTSTWEELGRPCSEQTLDHALACVERRMAAHDDERAVLVHGDVHEWNALATLDGGGFKLVDPDGLLAEPEYDLGVMLREDPREIDPADPGRGARWLAARTGLDATAIWEWGAVERLSTGLLCTRIDLQPIGREMLAAAELVADASDVVLD